MIYLLVNFFKRKGERLYMRYVVFGDTGGHFIQLKNGLLKSGMNDNYILPNDMTVIHCGDLMHKGPQSDEIIFMIDKIRKKNPGQWIQIMGNHEAQYLGGYYFRDNGLLSPEAAKIVIKWNLERFINFVYIIPEESIVKTETKEYFLNDPLIFSHAGLSYPFWKNYLKKYNYQDYNFALENTTLITVHKPGKMLGRNYNINSLTGPIWSHGIDEVWALWKKKNNARFNQIVGHIFPYHFNDIQNFFPGTDEKFINVAELHEKEHLTAAPLNKFYDKWMFFMDPGYMNDAHNDSQPYLEIFA